MFDDDVTLSVVFHNNPSGTSQSGLAHISCLYSFPLIISGQRSALVETQQPGPLLLSVCPYHPLALSLEREGQSSAQVQQTGACSSVSFYIFNL